MNKVILGIETSCDDTSIAIIRGDIQDIHKKPEILTLHNFSQEDLFSSWGGVIPEIASRNHLDKIVPLLKSALDKSQLKLKDIDIIGVTTHPGLLGPLLTGVNTAKTISMIHKTPIVSVNHLTAHLEAIHLTETIDYPYIGLLLSGGHSFFSLMKSPQEMEIIGSTVDDAAGEAFDKGGKILGLGYPAGKTIDELSIKGDSKKYNFPIGLRSSKDANLSFSGLKTSLKDFISKNSFLIEKEEKDYHQNLCDISASYQQAIIDAISLKLRYAIKKGEEELNQSNLPIVVGGGVASNKGLRNNLLLKYENIHFVSPSFCTDNAVMIANYAFRTNKEMIHYPETLSIDAQSRYLDKKKITRDVPKQQSFLLPIANKSLGQHFLNNKNIIKEITDDFKQISKNIIEVGAGTGILTQYLALQNKTFHIIEKDQRMSSFLENIIDKNQIHIEDALQLNLEEFILKNNLSDELWLVANLPYNISIPLFIGFLQTPQIKYMTLMFQREVADKIINKMRKKNIMGSLMALSQNYYDISILCEVAPSNFTPPPKVESTVLSLKRINNPVISLKNFSSFEKFLRSIFIYKRKQLQKVLKSYTTSEKIKSSLESLKIPFNIRGEALSLNEIQNLYLDLTRDENG